MIATSATAKRGGGGKKYPLNLKGHSALDLVSHMYATTTRGVSHCGLGIYIKKYLKAKEELWKLKYFTMQKT